MSTVGPDERERILRQIQKDAKGLLVDSYRQKFTRARNEYSSAVSSGNNEEQEKPIWKCMLLTRC